MNASQRLRYVRRRAGLTQRQLAARSSVPQPMIARIEAGRSTPSVDTMRRLVDACDFTEDIRPAPEVDRSAMRELLRLTPKERLDLAATEARNLEALVRR